MEQNMQSSENNAEIKLGDEIKPIIPKPEKKINKKIILLIIIIICSGAVYFLFLNKENDSKIFVDSDIVVLWAIASSPA